MTARGFYALLFTALMYVTALSTGSAGVFMLACVALCALAVSLAGALLSFLTLRVTQEVENTCPVRGESCTYLLRVRHYSPLPGAPALALISLPGGRTEEYRLSLRPFGETVSEADFSCPHVGTRDVGMLRIGVSDCFSFFFFSRRVRSPLVAVTVLPRPAEAEPLAFAPGEGESSVISRALADHTTPSDTRPWQEGDELKRVHWKLSLRRQQLMVHTYEQNPRPDALILMDYGAPEAPPPRAAHVVDRLCDTCAGIVRSMLDAGHVVRMPLYSAAGGEVSGQDSAMLPDFLHALAQQRFSEKIDFSRSLMLAARRMHRTGSAAILTSRITPRLCDDVIALSRMGPHTVFILVTSGALTQEQETMLRLLAASGVEACHSAA